MIGRQTDRRRFFVVSSDRAIRELARKKGPRGRDLRRLRRASSRRRSRKARSGASSRRGRKPRPRSRSISGTRCSSPSHEELLDRRRGTAGDRRSGRRSSGGAGGPRPSSTATPGRPAKAAASSAADGRPRRRPRRPGRGGAVIIAVPDDAVGRVAAGLARAGGSWAGPRRLSHERSPPGRRPRAARRGAARASRRSIPSSPFRGRTLPASVFRGITWGVEGGPGRRRGGRESSGRLRRPRPSPGGEGQAALPRRLQPWPRTPWSRWSGRRPGCSGRSGSGDGRGRRDALAPCARNFTERKILGPGKGPDRADPQGGRRHRPEAPGSPPETTPRRGESTRSWGNRSCGWPKRADSRRAGSEH